MPVWLLVLMAVSLHLFLVIVQDSHIFSKDGRLHFSGMRKSIYRRFQFLQVILGIILVIVGHVHLKTGNDVVQFFFFLEFEKTHTLHHNPIFSIIPSAVTPG